MKFLLQRAGDSGYVQQPIAGGGFNLSVPLGNATAYDTPEAAVDAAQARNARYRFGDVFVLVPVETYTPAPPPPPIRRLI